MKCYILMVSKYFPVSHPRKGDDTDFMESIQHYDKIHTIRSNYKLWKKRFEEIEKGNAYLSVRQWYGLPYRSKQQEIFRFDHRRKIGIEKLYLTEQGFMAIGNHIINIEKLAENDGLSKMDFIDWFRGFKIGDEKAIIHFTDFRYLLPNGYLNRVGMEDLVSS